MNIRARLTVIFFLVVIIVVTVISVSIYLLSANYRYEDFYRRLKNRATNTAKLLVEVAEVNADLLRRMERNNPASLPNQYILIYDGNDNILYNSEPIQKIPVDSSLIADIRKKKEIQFAYSEFEIVGFLFKDGNQTYTIVAAATDVYGLDALDNLKKMLFVIFLISVVLVSLLGWFFSGRVLSPIAKTVDDMGRITEINLSQRLDEGNGRDELAKLAITFNKMLSRLQSAFSSQKTFIANASHEIKTPITVMSGEIEVTLLHERDKDYYIRILRSVLNGLKGLNRLSTQLLVLAQASSAPPVRDELSIRIDDILWEIKDELTKLHPEYKIDIELGMDINHESLSIKGDEQLLKVAIMNLLDNGCKYSSDNHVTVHISGSKPLHVSLGFVNDGEGIQPDNLERIFDPFFRATKDKSRRGFGIGLSLVRRIAQLHGGTITVHSIPHEMTKFTLDLPTTSLEN